MEPKVKKTRPPMTYCERAKEDLPGIYKAGYRCGEAGISASRNPYRPRSNAHGEWARGHKAGFALKEERAIKLMRAAVKGKKPRLGRHRGAEEENLIRWM